MQALKRSSGLLIHPTSFPGPFGIGEINAHAYKWIDFMKAAGQTIWQILPLGPTGYGNSPYQTSSVFAGNPLLIDPIRLASEGYLSENELKNAPSFPIDCVDFEPVINWKMPLLLGAYERFLENPAEKDAFTVFCKKHDALWLDEFATFMAVKNSFNKVAWWDWPKEIRTRQASSLADLRYQLANEIQAHKFLQFQFFKQWNDLKQYANQHGISIMGDIPIYVASDSAEVWANQDAFHLDKDGNPTVVAGVPPDHFTEHGQLWGNPIYRWDVMKKNDFRWWCERVQVTMECVDLVRLDHFRGFEAYWAVPYEEETAVNGKWLKGPGGDLFDALKKELGDIPIIAEDLGFITPGVNELRDKYNLPGMKILQFAFYGDPDEPFLPHNYPQNCVVYTGSHDNDTTRGWFKTASEAEKNFMFQYLNTEKHEMEISWELMRVASASTAVLCIFPAQDVLNLGNSARMNKPGEATGNWGWRITEGELTDAHAASLKQITTTYGRMPSTKKGSE